ncbi:hypothetical protein [Paenibacillus protaetiae]|uniref:Glycosyl transferase family 28 C-terminal domain-containing protein n=1 Tax=Paenibacillus protaetiae TaxID=2509456 RepID=A0A4P6F3M6_9BACL|nr:hypothetical protein [Paenibacillus protaetiae]QAY67767.1 hypothetical protein ET464_16610 [Paenibacillus protaetiae]
MSDTDPQLYAVVPQQDVELHKVDGVFPSFDGLLPQLMALKPEKVVIDGPIDKLDVHFLQKLRLNGIRIMIINDAKERLPSDCYDAMVCCSIKYAGQSVNQTPVYLGPEYIILDDRFQKLKAGERFIPHEARRLLLSFGGTDPGRITPLAIDYLNRCAMEEIFHIDVILGTYSEPLDARLIESSRHHIQVFRGVSDMAERLYKTDIAIISGGMTLYEACSLGTPVMAINQNEEQQAEAAGFEAEQAIMNLGLHEACTLSHFSKQLNRLLRAETRLELSRRALRTIDGKGTDRIIAAIELM